jgi:hypothetical protein
MLRQTAEGRAMSAISIRKKIDSETLYLPELRPLIGKTVEIIVTEQPLAEESAERWQALREIVGEDLIDPEVYKRQREFDRQHANDHLP